MNQCTYSLEFGIISYEMFGNYKYMIVFIPKYNKNSFHYSSKNLEEILSLYIAPRLTPIFLDKFSFFYSKSCLHVQPSDFFFFKDFYQTHNAVEIHRLICPLIFKPISVFALHVIELCERKQKVLGGYKRKC